MRTDRTLRSDRAVVFRKGVVVAPVVVVVALALPALATAGSLLSGYGGPGQGSQQLLGSSVIGGGAGSGGGSGGAGSGGGSGGGGYGQGSASGGESLGLRAASSPGSSPSGERTQSGASGSSGSGTGGAGGGGRAGGGAGKGGGSGAGQSDSRSHSAAGTSGAAVIAYPKVSVERAYLAGAGSGSAEWESGVWPYVLLALAVVALAGALTRRLAAGKGSGEHRSLKGWVAGPE
jgi:hypothetical protein